MGFSLATKRQVLTEQGYKCLCCQRQITLTAMRLRDWKKILGHYPDTSVPSQAKFHHKKHCAQGGSDAKSNCAALCGRCHTQKAHKPWKVEVKP